MLEIECDKFKNTFVIDLHKTFTKGRDILRLIASIYNPLGIISPTVVLFKIYFQKLEHWSKFRNDFGVVKTF